MGCCQARCGRLGGRCHIFIGEFRKPQDSLHLSIGELRSPRTPTIDRCAIGRLTFA
jgi:hypothetical protein